MIRKIKQYWFFVPTILAICGGIYAMGVNNTTVRHSIKTNSDNIERNCEKINNLEMVLIDMDEKVDSILLYITIQHVADSLKNAGLIKSAGNIVRNKVD